MSDASDEIQDAERAGFYVGAITVMGREFHRRVTEAVITPDEPWLGEVYFAAELASSYDKEQARLGKADAMRRTQEAAMILMSGAIALDLIEDSDPPRFTTDPLVARARSIMTLSNPWAAEAEACLRWLRHRTVSMLACPARWRIVAGLAQTLMADGRLSARRLNEVMDQIARRRTKDSCEWIIDLDLRSSTLLDEPPPQAGVKAPKDDLLLLKPPEIPSKRATDAIVTRDLFERVAGEFNNTGGVQAAMQRLKDREPLLLWAIQQEASMMDKHFQSTSLPPAMTAAAAVVRCGTLVAELLHRGHARLWRDAENLLPKQK